MDGCCKGITYFVVMCVIVAINYYLCVITKCFLVTTTTEPN